MEFGRLFGIECKGTMQRKVFLLFSLVIYQPWIFFCKEVRSSQQVQLCDMGRGLLAFTVQNVFYLFSFPQ